MNHSTHDAPPQRMFQLITGYWATQIVASVARFGVADILADGPASSDSVAEAAGAHPAALYRVLRAAAALGLVQEDEKGVFSLTPVGQTLRANVPGSMRDFAIAQASPGHWLPWGQIEHAVKSGKSTSKPALGMEIFEWYASHPQEAASFNGAMTNLSAMVADELINHLSFGAERLVDVGGSRGTLLTAVLAQVAGASGVLFDLPHVIEDAKKAIAARDLAARVECVGGDFFQSVPRGDAYILKHILHDWNDEECKKILANCAESADPKARLVLVEMVIPDDGSPSPAPLMDINMLVMLPGKERTLGEYESLLASARWDIQRVLPAKGGFSIIEAVRA